MVRSISPILKVIGSPGSQATPAGEGSWRLWIPSGKSGDYRIAQLDDYQGVPRSQFPWRPPLTLALRARASAGGIPGTWGFGLWNDPFSLSLGFKGGTRHLPALPNTAWFFHASPPNYLSLRDDLPAQGFLAATFQSPTPPGPLLALASPVLTLLVLPAAARLLRRLARQFIRQDAVQIDANQSFVDTEWHAYRIDWLPGTVTFAVDGETVLTTQLSPHGPLSLVLWIDNQYAAFPPNGRTVFGTLQFSQPVWLDIIEIRLELP